jgi:PAS domain S-box-containing protein
MERERAEEALALEILNNTQNLIFVKDTEGRYLFVNRRFERTFHVRLAEIKDKRDEEIFPSEQAGAFGSHDRRAIETKEVTFHDDGPIRPTCRGLHYLMRAGTPTQLAVL